MNLGTSLEEESLEEENESWDSMHTYVHVDIHTNTYIHAYIRTHTYTAVVLGQAATPSCLSHSIIFLRVGSCPSEI